MKKDRLPKYLQLPNIFKDHRIVARPTPMTVGYDEWPLSNALCIKFYNGHDKYKPELNEYFHMYQCQLNFVMFCATSALGIFANTSIISNCLYTLFIDFMCIFMYD